MITTSFALGNTPSEKSFLDDKRKSVMPVDKDSFSAAWELSVPFAAQVAHPDTFSLDFSHEKIDWKAPEIQAMMKEVPNRYYPELSNSRNPQQLAAKIQGIKLQEENQKELFNNYSLGTSMGLMAAASIFDPVSLLGYGAAARIANSAKLAAEFEKSKKLDTAYWAAAGATIEGGSQAQIESYGTSEYSSVPLAAGFGAVLVGGTAGVSNLLANTKIRNKEKAIEELSKKEPDLSTPEGQVEAANLVEQINSESLIQPVRNKISELYYKTTGKHLPFMFSPTYHLGVKGGKAAAFARRLDTPAMLMKDENGNLLKHVDETAADVKYEINEDFLKLEVERIKSLEESELNPHQFNNAVYETTQLMRQKYDRDLEAEMYVLKNDKEFMKAKQEELQKKIEDEELELSAKEKEEYIAREVKKEAINKLSEKEYTIETGNKGVKRMVEATSRYYESMHKRMLEAGFEGAETMTPKFYMPIVYDTRAIKLERPSRVEQNFERAIRESEAYKTALGRAKESLDNARKMGSTEEIQKFKEELERLNNDIEDLEDMMRIVNGEFHSPDFTPLSAKGRIPFVERKINYIRRTKQMEDVIDKVLKSNPIFKELLDLAGMPRESIIPNLLGKPGEMANYNPMAHAIGIAVEKNMSKSAMKDAENILKHELIHSLTKRLLSAPENEAIKRSLAKVLKELKKPEKLQELRNLARMELEASEDIVKTMDMDTDHFIDYMLGLKEFKNNSETYTLNELMAVSLSNKYIARALNKMAFNGTATESKNIFKAFLDAFKKMLGFRVKKGSTLEKIMNDMSSLTEVSPATKSVRERAMKIKTLQHKLDIVMHSKDGKLTTRMESERKAILDEMDIHSKEILKSLKAKKKRILKERGKIVIEMNKKLEAASSSGKEYNKLLKYPKHAAKGMVERITNEDHGIANIDFANINPTRLKGRHLPVDINHEAISPYVIKDEASLNTMYNYQMSGRIAAKKVFGTDKPEEMRTLLKDEVGMSKEELQQSMDAFELFLGSKQIPTDPDSVMNKSVRMMKQLNYVTMGGQFGVTQLSEAGSGVYRLGFGFLPKLFPAMKTVTKMYKGEDITRIAEQSMYLAHAGSIYERKLSNAIADSDYIESTFAGGLEKKLKEASSGMFKWSGLEGLTTMMDLAIPESFLSRIIKEADRPTAQLDMLRWGIDLEDMKLIKEQPVIYKDGALIDFNFDAWNPAVRQKFARATQRMSRDTIMKADAWRVPTWVNDGNANPVVKLTGQFTTFGFLSNERLLLAGLNEKQAEAITGLVVSAAILYSAKAAEEQGAVAVGLMDDEDRYYTKDEEGMQKLAKYVFTRNSFAGNISLIAETINAFTSSNPFETQQMMSNIAGGPSGARAFQIAKSANDLYSGKTGTKNQMRAIKGLIPFNNLLGLDAFFNHQVNDIVDESKRRRYYEQ